MNALNAILQSWLFGEPTAPRPLWHRALRVAGQFLYALARDLMSGQLTLRAMSLVYTTLLSVVPLLAFSFSLFKGFGIHNNLKDELYNLMAPLGDKGKEITDWVIRTVDNVEGGVLGTVSLAFFIYTAIAMVQKVEASFNFVWQVGNVRNLARRITEYVSVLLIGPLAMGIALTLIASISSHAVVVELSSIEPLGSAMVALGKTLPYLLVIGVFTFLYKFLPNARVSFASALTGGVASGFLWASAGAIFASFVAVSATRNAIYSTFAVAISALIWLYVSWLILLIGAQIAFYAENPVFLRLGRTTPTLSHSFRERLALNVMYVVGKAFRSDRPEPSVEALAARINVPALTLNGVLHDLSGAGLIRFTEDGTLVPGREMSRLRLSDIDSGIRERGDTGASSAPVWSQPVAQLSDAIGAARSDILANMTLAEWLDKTTHDAEDDPQRD
ncbi:MAG: YihY/virulence factor BrkB family protein [Pseudomonadota bacterium]